MSEEIRPNSPSISNQLVLLYLPTPLLRHANQPVQEDRREEVENNINEQKPDVPPPVREIDIQLRQELVGRIHRTETAHRGRVRVQHAATRRLDIRPEVASAGLAGRGREVEEFNV